MTTLFDFDALALAEAKAETEAQRRCLAEQAAPAAALGGARCEEAAGSMEEPPSVAVRVRGGLSGDELCCFAAAPGAPLHALKARIAEAAGVAAEEQTLLLAPEHRRLCDHEVLGDLLGGGAAVPAVDLALIRRDPARQAVLEDVRQGNVKLRQLSDDLRADLDVVLAALERDRFALEHAAPAACAERAVVLRAVSNCGLALRHAAEALRADRAVVLAAVEEDPEALAFASEALRADPSVCLAAVSRSGDALRLTSEACRADPSLVRAAVGRHGLALKYASARLQADRAIVLAAVQRTGAALQHAAEALRADAGVVRAAVRSSGGVALEFAAERLRADRRLVLEAVRLFGLVLRSAAPELRRDREVVLAAVGSNGLALEFAAGELRSDTDVVLAAVRAQGAALEYAADTLRADRAVVLAAVRSDGDALRFASGALQACPHVVAEALQNSPKAIRYACPSLMADGEFLGWLEALGLFRDEDFEERLVVRPALAHGLWEEGRIVFVDARGAVEFRTSHIPGACSLPFNQVKQELASTDAAVLAPMLAGPPHLVVVYSDNGLGYSRCVQVARALREDGRVAASRVLRLEGGLNCWKEAGLPVDGDTRTMILGHAVAPQDLPLILQARLYGM